MEFIFYVSFVYMVVHLVLFSFKKGEHLSYQWEDNYLSMYRANYFQERIWNKWKKNIHSKSRKVNKYRLMLTEIEKGYKEPFSNEFVDELIEERFANDLFEEIKPIFEYKERREYKKFPFDDSSNISRRLQFLTIKKTISEIQMENFFQVLFKQYEKGLMKEVELNDWKPIFTKLGFLDDKERPTTVNSISEALKMRKNETTVVSQEEVPVVIREVTKRKTARFDSKLR